MPKILARGLNVIFFVGALSLAGTGSALAAPGDQVPCPPGFYPANAVCVEASANKTVVTAGGTITVTVRGFQSDGFVTFYLYSTPVSLGTFQADGAGNLTRTFTIPKGTPAGIHHIVATGRDAIGAPRRASVEFRVVAGAQGSGLPLTGAEIGAGSLLGFALVGGGGVAVVAGRRRKTQAAA